MQTGVIYKVTCLVNGKVYIGQTVDLKARIRSHFSTKQKYHFGFALQKYGKDNFLWEIVEECPKDMLDDREQYWIAFYNSNDSRYGYNLTIGGDNGDALVGWIRNHPEESKEFALNASKKATEYWDAHPEERVAMMKRIQPLATAATMKKVRCVENGLEFQSLSEAEKWSLSDENPVGKKCSHQHISKVCNGLRHTCGGYHWEYVD